AFIYFAQQVAVGILCWTGNSKPPTEFHRKFRLVYLVAAGASIGMVVAWKTFDMPIYAGVALGVAADAFVLWPTVQESWSQPDTEPWWVWATDVLAAILMMAAVRHYSFSSTFYPFYLVVGCGIMACLPVAKWWHTRKAPAALPQEHIEGVGA